ncbi:MAG: RDD family protein [Dehalococcoidia bacterium]|nr:RDD family protein [Dehalococcoidia bacterium]
MSPPEKKLCRACGTVNAASSSYCYKCGVPLGDTAGTPAETIGNPAGFRIRLAAYGIDQVFLLFFSIALALILSGVSFREVVSDIFRPDAPFSWGEFALGTLIEAFYWTFTVGTWGATIGKAVLRLKVVRVNGSKLSYTRSFARYWAYYVSFLPAGIGFLAIGLNPKKRGFHDYISDTRVVRLKD